MSEKVIQQVRFDSDGRIRLRPSEPSDYTRIYRAALSVRWDSANGELYMLEITGFDAIAEFKQILLAVAQEYRDSLVLRPMTKYIGIFAETEASLVKSAG